MKFLLYANFFFVHTHIFAQHIKLPINAANRSSISELRLTEIGPFGLIRNARPNVRSHHHTGIDIMRPGLEYDQNPIFPIEKGIVISKRNDGPFAQLIVEHRTQSMIFWSVYEHVAEIRVNVNDIVNVDQPIARFMNRNELNIHGWQFDHFRLEILKVRPSPIKRNQSQPERHFNAYTLVCYSEEDLMKYYYNPLQFFNKYL